MRELLRKLPYGFRSWFRTRSRIGEWLHSERWMP